MNSLHPNKYWMIIFTSSGQQSLYHYFCLLYCWKLYPFFNKNRFYIASSIRIKGNKDSISKTIILQILYFFGGWCFSFLDFFVFYEDWFHSMGIIFEFCMNRKWMILYLSRIWRKHRQLHGYSLRIFKQRSLSAAIFY